MKNTNIKTSILVFLVMGCSPDNKPDNNDFNDIHALNSEAALEKVAQAKINASEKELITVSKNKSAEDEQALLDQVNKKQIQSEKELIETQSLQQLLVEQALLEDAKSRRDEVEVRDK